VGVAERLTIPLPHGQRLIVVSDLELSPRSDPDALSPREFASMLDEIDDASVVVVAGNLFDGVDGNDAGGFVAESIAQHPALRRAVERFTSEPYRRLVALPGARDGALYLDEEVVLTLTALGVELAHEVVAEVATAQGVKELVVTTGSTSRDVEGVPDGQCEDARRLDDPTALRGFTASRLLYGGLAKWLWFPLWALLVLDVLGSLIGVFNHVTHRHLHVHRTHPSNEWSTLLLSIVLLVAFEALVAVIAGVAVRRRFERLGPREEDSGEPLAATTVGGLDALEFARRVVSRGGAGAVVGGAPQPALAFLDDGLCASPGPSRLAFTERRNRVGLPSVFAPLERFGVVEVEAASTVRVRLLARAIAVSSTNRLERWLGGAARQPLPPSRTDAIAAWPDGAPWPAAPDRLGAQRRQRTVRRVASGLLLVTGVIDVAVAVSPPLRQRLEDALSILPIGVLEGAAAVTAIAGVAMIMVARGVRRGQHRAWLIAVMTLLVTIATHLLRGGTPIGSLLALGVLAILVLGRDNFTASTDRSSLEAAWPRLLLVALLAVVATTVGVELSDLHRHALPGWPIVMAAGAERLVGLSTIALPDKIADFVDPTMLAVGLTLLVIALYLATRPVVDRRLAEQASSGERRRSEQRARDIVVRHGRGTLDYFALRDDKQFFFHRDSLVAYAVYGGVALISPDPIGPDGDRAEVFSAFRSFAESRGWTIGVMAAGEAWLSTYAAAGLHSIYLGDEAIVDCPSFSLAGGQMKGLRQACTRLARHGYTVEFHDPSRIDPVEVSEVVELIAKLRRGEGERGFSMMLGRLFDPRDEGLLLTIVKGPDGVPASVCQFVPSPAVGGYSLDLMRRDPGEHPNGLIDYALCSTIAHLAEDGHHGLSLNFAAFRSVLDGERGEGTFTKVERWALRRLSGILPIETLWSFNAKFQPSWLPRYLVYPAAESFVPVVAAILRAEAITEIPVVGRLLAQDPSNRPGTIVPEEVLEQARHAGARN
jgi:lysylphosphatidylglycerol synthetase-like protein (DUF2156 family)